jgi:cytochrome P450
MTGMLIFQDPTVFPDPSRFDPERWIANPRLSRYQVAFSKGSRICVGINLAYAEITILLAGLFRQFGSQEVHRNGDIGTLRLFETTVDNDIECWVDAIAPLPKQGSKGVRLQVLPMAE